MKIRTNKFIAIVLILMMVMSLNVTAFAAENEDSTDVTESLTFIVGGYTVTDWATAKSYASLLGVNRITLGADSVLASELDIPSGYTLVIPTSADASDSETGNNVSGTGEDITEGVKLTMVTGSSITVNGTLLVAGNQQSTQPKSGCLTGSYGVINMASGSTITVNDGGKLYARGEISGEGSVVAKNGSTVYQLFQILDWRGGTAAQSAFGAGIFPFNLYAVNNITAKTTYNYGSSLIGQYYIYASLSHNTGEVPMIGSGAQLEFGAEGSSIVLTTSDGVTTATVNGTVKTGHISVSLSAFGISTSITSSSTVCPFGYNMDVEISSGSTLEITNKIKVLPGCTFTNDGTLTVDADGAIYFYGENGYLTTYNNAGWNGDGAAASLTGSGVVNNSGVIASTSNTLANVNGFSASTDDNGDEVTATVYEYVSGSTPVTFYVGTSSSSTTAAAE